MTIRSNLLVIRWICFFYFEIYFSVSLSVWQNEERTARQRMKFLLDTFLMQEQQRNYTAGAIFQISIVTSRTLGKNPEWSLCKDLAFTLPLCLPLSLCLSKHRRDCRGSLGWKTQQRQQLFRSHYFLSFFNIHLQTFLNVIF